MCIRGVKGGERAFASTCTRGEGLHQNRGEGRLGQDSLLIAWDRRVIYIYIDCGVWHRQGLMQEELWATNM